MLDKENQYQSFCDYKTNEYTKFTALHHGYPNCQNIKRENVTNLPAYDYSTKGNEDKVIQTNTNHPLNELSYHDLTSTPTHRQMKRLRANDRERRRVHSINHAMEKLKSIIPGLNERKKLTKLELLRSANQYIWILDEALRTGNTVDDQFRLLHKEPVVYCVSYPPMPVLKLEPLDY